MPSSAAFTSSGAIKKLKQISLSSFKFTQYFNSKLPFPIPSKIIGLSTIGKKLIADPESTTRLGIFLQPEIPMLRVLNVILLHAPTEPMLQWNFRADRFLNLKVLVHYDLQNMSVLS